MAVLSRLEGLLLLGLALYLGAGTAALAFLNYLSGSAPVPKMLLANGLYLLATIACAVGGVMLLVKPNTNNSIIGVIVLGLVGMLWLAGKMGWFA